MMTTPSTALIGLVLGACAIAAASDAVSRRIPNIIPLLLAVAVLTERALHGWGSVGTGLAAIAIVLVTGTFVHSRGWFGGGDVKLAAAVAGAFGLPACFTFLLFTGVCGGFVALATLALTRRLGAREALFAVDTLVRSRVVALTHAKATVPYAIAIAFGAVLTSLSASIPALHLL